MVGNIWYLKRCDLFERLTSEQAARLDKQAVLGHANLGLGVGLRTVHFPYILKHHPAVDRFAVDLGQWFRDWTAEGFFLSVAQ